MRKENEKDMKTKLLSSTTVVAAILLLSMFMFVPVKAVTYGPRIDKVRLEVVTGPSAEVIAMQTEETHYLPDLIRTGDIEKLDDDGFTITFAPGFHMGHIGFNIRPDQSYRTDRPEEELTQVAKVLSDVNFRHAVIHAYDQDGILATIYEYIVTKSTSLVPPAQGGWLSPTVPQHPFNPGDPLADTVWNPATGENEDSCSILRYGGYTYHGTGYGDTEAYWTHPDGFALPTIKVFTPTYDVAPTSAEHGAKLIAELNNIGLNNVKHEPFDFAGYIQKVFGAAEFDMYMVFWGLGRFPDHLYDMLHSSQDTAVHPWRYNAPGVNDPYVDPRVETIKFSLDAEAQLTAAYEVQDWIYNPVDNPQALPYMQLYSRLYFSAANPKLRGIINAPGYGSDNTWTWLNWHWNPGEEYVEDGRTTVVYSNGEYPESLNPTFASTVYAWNIIGPTLDGLIGVNPYTLGDIPWLADSWTVTPTSTGMEITFDLRAGVEWQDGNPYIAEDAAFNWLFFRNNAIPRYSSGWEHITDVQVITPGEGGEVKVVFDKASRFLLYDVAGMAAILPPPVWSPWDGQPLADILAYNPDLDTDKPEGAGPRFGEPDGPQNCLYGTGPYIFQLQGPDNAYADLYANRHWWKTTDEIESELVQMFHEAGDVDYNGELDADDQTAISTRGFFFPWDEGWLADADINSDGIIDMIDYSYTQLFWGKTREYPYPP